MAPKIAVTSSVTRLTGWMVPARRAREGVRVRLLLDGFGALMLPRDRLDALRAAGAEVTVFRPLLSLRRSGPRNLRNHRKMLIADDGRIKVADFGLARAVSAETQHTATGGVLTLSALWPEPGVAWGRGRTARLQAELERAARFVGAARVDLAPGWLRLPGTTPGSPPAPPR